MNLLPIPALADNYIWLLHDGQQALVVDPGAAEPVLQVLQSAQGPNPVCSKCEGTNKDKPIQGMTILWNLRPDGTNKWANGTILDPAKGKTYSSKVALVDNGRKLDVSGCIAFICRTQTWLRDQ